MNHLIEIIQDWAGQKISDIKSAPGGDIARSQIITVESGHKYFLKSGARHNLMFPTEANSLKELSKADVLRVPQVYLSDKSFLLIEYIEQSRPSDSFFEDFGRRFAALHKFSAQEFGFFEDNFIGHTPQHNIPDKNQARNWTAFYFEKRLFFQFSLAEKQGLSSSALRAAFKQLESKIESILRTEDALPALLHGDLWSGNFISDVNGAPVIMDPAVYYGHREADLAMTKVFGGFSKAFYDAYNEAYPLAEGYAYRENIYKLYHILNHLNLFGMGYHNQALSLMQSYL